MAHAVLVAKYPNSQFCSFRFENCARPYYDGTQYYLTNLSTGWTSGWQNTPPVSISGSVSSNFNISMSTGYYYSVRTRMMWNGVWYEGQSGYEPIYIDFPNPSRPPTGSPYVIHYNSVGTTINLQVLDSYGATTIGFIPSWDGIDYRRAVGSTPYIETFYAPEYGTEYQFGKKGYNIDGESSRTYLWVTTEPAIPSISNLGNIGGLNTITLNISPRGGFTTIEVEMWTIGASSLLATRTQGWNGGGSFNVQFGALTPNASYMFRARASKTSSNSNYHPNSGWGGWVTIKNDMIRPANWKWITSQNTNGHKISGAGYSMLATEWNDFTSRINAFREYRGLSRINFTTAYKGSVFYYYMFNEAIRYIGDMNNTGVGNVSSQSKLFASNFNSLMNALNNIS